MRLINFLDAIEAKGFILDSELIDLGVSNKLTQELLSANFLVAREDGKFSLGSVDNLFNFALKYWKHDKEFTMQVMDLCYAKDKYNVNVNLWFLNNSVHDGKLAIFAEHLKNLEEVFCDDPKHTKDINFFYMLMSKAFDNVDSAIIAKVKGFTCDDVFIAPDDVRYQHRSYENEIRQSVYENYTIEADIKTDRKIDALSRVTVYDSIAAKLIKMANAKYKAFGRMMVEELHNGNFEMVHKALLKREELGQASKNDIYTLKILNSYLEIVETSRIPIRKTMANADTYDHIDNKDFRRALASYRKVNTNNSMYFMLVKINELISSIVEYRKARRSECKTLDSVIEAVYIGDYQAIKEYLEEIDMADYYYLVRDVIMINALDNDQTFSESIQLLMDLSDNSFYFDSSKYVELYKKFISNYEYNKAKLCYDILENSQTFIFNPDLEVELNNLYQEITGHKLGKIVVDEEYGVMSLKSYVRLKVKELEMGKSVVVLPALGYKKTKDVYDTISHFDGVVCFSIEDDDEKKAVLRKRRITDEFVSLSPLLDEFQKYYVFHDYQKALEYGRELLLFGKPGPGMYGKMGLLLFNVGEYNEAIDCLKIANSMARQREWDTNYNELISHCKSRRRNSFQTKFGGSFKQLFKSEAELINSLIVLSRDGTLSLEEALEALDLDMEKINYAKLVYARDCYSDGDFNLGDQYLKEVINSGCKNSHLKLLIKNLQANRAFYYHRKNQHMNCLVIKR